MSTKNSITTADALPWDSMLRLVRNLYKDGNYRLSLFVACASFFGLRASDVLRLSWRDLLDGDTFALVEKKTGKRRVIAVNRQLRRHVEDCYTRLGAPSKSEPVFKSRKGGVYTIQRINVLLKECKERYNIDIEHFSTHTCRKTFGRELVRLAGANSEMALIKLSELFNHSSTAITRRYLGLRQEEILECYSLFSF